MARRVRARCPNDVRAREETTSGAVVVLAKGDVTDRTVETTADKALRQATEKMGSTIVDEQRVGYCMQDKRRSNDFAST